MGSVRKFIMEGADAWVVAEKLDALAKTVQQEAVALQQAGFQQAVRTMITDGVGLARSSRSMLKLANS